MRIGPVENSRNIGLYAVFGLVFVGIGVGTAGTVPFVALIFGGIGAVFVFAAVHAGVGHARYGDVLLDVDAPVVPGGRFVARLTCPEGAAGATSVRTELRCKRVEWQRDAGGKSTLAEITAWQAERSFPLHMAGTGAHCDIVFDMPGDAPLSSGGSSDTKTRPGVYWELQVMGDDVEGVDLMRGFRFPVVAGTPDASASPSVLLKPSVPTVTPTPAQAARIAQAKRDWTSAGKAAAVTAVIALAGVLALLFFGLVEGRRMGRFFFAVFAAPMAVYWAINYRNWQRQRAEDPKTPTILGAFIWHMLVLAAIAWQML